MYQGPTRTRKVNPRESANIFSVLTFFFTNNIFRKGFKKELEEEDIYKVLVDYRSSKLGDQIEKQWNKEESKKKPSLFRLIWSTFGKQYFIAGILKFIFRTIDMIIKPLCIGKLILHFSASSSNMSVLDAYGYAALLICSSITFTTVHHAYMLYISQLAQKLRIGLCSLMYRKSLKLSSSSIAGITTGKIITLMTKDVMIFENIVQYTNDIWFGIIHTLIATYLIYQQIGMATFAGVAFLLIVSPLQIFGAKKTVKTKFMALAKSDERLKVIQEVLSAIQLIKIYTLENYFSQLVNYIRKSEVAKIKIIYYIKVTMISVGILSTRISFFFCIIIYTLSNGSITAEKAFVVLTCYVVIQYFLNTVIPMGVTQIGEAKSTVERIESMLLTKEVKQIAHHSQNGASSKIEAVNLSVVVNSKPILENINLHLGPGLYGVTGDVGSGKSTLLKTCLKDFPISAGSLNINGTISYAPQEPWLFPGTIKQNILFGSAYDPNHYQNVVRMCGLLTDIDHLSKHDCTIVSDKGVNLSKGQQARINLARAVYKDADIYLLDNPLAALDVAVGMQVYEQCIKDFLSNKLCILVTHQIKILQQVGKVIVMKAGRVEAQGTYTELEHCGVDFGFDYIGNSSVQKAHLSDTEEDEGKDDATEESALLGPKSDAQNEKATLYSEVKKKGNVAISVYKTYYKCLGGIRTVPAILFLLMAGQMFSSTFDYYISYWTNIEEKLLNVTNTTGYEDLVYIRSNIPFIYSGLIAGATIFTFLGSLMMFIRINDANRKLHNMTFSQLLKAHMVFFNSNLSGNILNRFSKDMATLDECIPVSIFQCLKALFAVIGLSIVLMVIKIQFFVLTFALIAILYFSRLLYMPTSRSLKRLDGVTRSPLLGHLNASLDGVTTIRATGMEDILKSEFDEHQDLHSSTSYMYLSTHRAFGFVLDMLSVIYTSIVILVFMVLSGSTSGNVGLGITQSFQLSGMLQYGMRQLIELENQMTSVERVIEYTEVESESKDGKKPADWPKQGNVVYKNVKLRYPKRNDLVLDDVTFTVEPKQKIGIIGRTGSGKTSLISTLFRLYDTESGSITIDGYNIKEISLGHLRSSISLIPQNPVLFSGTLRSNLDPYNECCDAVLWRALEEVDMKHLVSNLDLKLDFRINEGDAIFSSGHKQMISLARAIVRKHNIVVLDEATANVDSHTEEVIQRAIEKNFADCTVLTIAHRSTAIAHADKVMEIGDGKILKFD